MKIALINGSPKMKNSNSGYALEVLKRNLTECDISEYNLHKPQMRSLDTICDNEIFVFSFPLYVDGIPSHLLNCLHQMEQYLKDKHSDILVYAMANCGFYEGHQNDIALTIMENWCARSNITWAQGIGIGGGGMLSMVNNSKFPEKGPLKNSVLAIKEMSSHILEKKCGENSYVNPNFPRILYKMAGEMGWRHQIRANGLKAKDLFRQK